MRRVLLALALILLPLAARAACPPVPFSFVPGTIADANQVNANFAALENCFSTIPTVSIAALGATPDAPAGFQPTPIDPAGTPDMTAIINQALATGNSVYIPPGYWHVKGQIVCTAYGQQLIGAGRLQSVIDVGSDFNMAASSVINQGNGSVQVQGGCELKDIGIQFYQNSADTLRSQLIQYPPAVISQASRNLIDNIRISRGWDCLKYNGNFTFILLGSVELGCFDQNIYAQGQLDFSFIHHVEVWPFGSSGVGTLGSIWTDKSTQAFFFNNSDGIEINNMSTFAASGVVGPAEPTATGIDFNRLHMDGFSTLTVQSGGVSIGAFSGADDGGASAIPSIVVAVPTGTLGQLSIGTIQYETSNSNGGAIQVTGGKLIISGGHIFNNVDACNLSVSTASGPAYLKLSGVFISPPTNGVNLSNPVVCQTTGALEMTGNTFNTAQSGETGAMVSIATDNIQTFVADNNYGAWINPVSLGFLPSTGGVGIAGYYDFGGVQFPFTVTPAFVTEGDYAPTGVSCTGCLYELNGDYATFDLNLSWTNNAYTTAGGTFVLNTDLPRSISPTTVGSPIPIAEITGETFSSSPAQFPLTANLNGASTLAFGLAQSGTSVLLANAANFPASRAYNAVLGGRYPIRSK